MKLAVLLILAICSYAAQAQSSDELDVFSDDMQIQPRGPILDAVLRAVQKITSDVRQIIENIIVKTEEIVNDVRVKIENAAKLALDKIRILVDDIENRLRKMAKAGNAAKACIDDGRPKIKQAIQNAEEDNKQCIRGTIEQAKNIVNEIKKHIEAIQDKVDAMQDMVADCMENNGRVFGLTKCITKQVWEFNKNIFGMVGNVKDLVVEATKSAVKVVANGISCLVDVGRITEKQITAAVKGIEQCIASNKLEDFKNKVMLT